MAAIPQYASTPRIGAATLTTADTSLTAPATAPATVIVGASSGTRIEKLGIKAVGSTVLGLVRWFIHDGTTYTLIAERLIPISTSSNTSACFEETISSISSPNLLPIHLPNASWSIRATTTVAQTGLRVRAEVADL